MSLFPGQLPMVAKPVKDQKWWSYLIPFLQAQKKLATITLDCFLCPTLHLQSEPRLHFAHRKAITCPREKIELWVGKILLFIDFDTLERLSI